MTAFHPALKGEVEQRSGADAGADRTRHAGAAKPAIAGRILGQILLMIVLGEIELACRRDLGGDGAEALGRQRLLVGRLRFVGGFALRVAKCVDRGTILEPKSSPRRMPWVGL